MHSFKIKLHENQELKTTYPDILTMCTSFAVVVKGARTDSFSSVTDTGSPIKARLQARY